MDYSGGFQQASEDMGERSGRHQPHFTHSTSSSIGESQKAAYYNNSNISTNISCDIKPRLTKDQHDLLEKEYKKHPKPVTAVKKGFAETLGVSLDKVNVSTRLLSVRDAVAETCNRTGFRIGGRRRSKMRRKRPARSTSTRRNSRPTPWTTIRTPTFRQHFPQPTTSR